jgi:hypothetical protein
MLDPRIRGDDGSERVTACSCRTDIVCVIEAHISSSFPRMRESSLDAATGRTTTLPKRLIVIPAHAGIQP